MKLSPFIQEIVHILPLPGQVSETWVEISEIDPNKPTIILVSGFGATRRTLTIMRKRLIKDGFNVFAVGLEWTTISEAFLGFFPVAHKIYSLILRIRKLRGMQKSKIYLVAHSAGGLASRWYIQMLGGSHYCDALVTLGTPHRGTWVAGLGFISHLALKARCLYQMLPFSRFIRSLNKTPYPKNFPTLALSSNGDFLCPKQSTALPDTVFGNQDVTAVELSKISHSEFLMSKKSYSLMSSFLHKLSKEETPAPLLQIL